MIQGFWTGVLPSLVMVSNPSVNYMLFEYLRSRLEDWRRVASGAFTTCQLDSCKPFPERAGTLRLPAILPVSLFRKPH